MEKLKAELRELNYLYPFSADSMPLVAQLTRDLVDIASAYKELEKEQAVALTELERIGFGENPRLVQENAQLRIDALELGQELDAARLETAKTTESNLKLELFACQLTREKSLVCVENDQLKTRLQQLLKEEFICPEVIHISGRLEVDPPSLPGGSHALVALDEAELILNLQTTNANLQNVIATLHAELNQYKGQYNHVRDKFLTQSPLTLSGGLAGLSNKNQSGLVAQLESKLDYLNAKYTELKQLHIPARPTKNKSVDEASQSDLEVPNENSYSQTTKVVKIDQQTSAKMDQLKPKAVKPSFSENSFLTEQLRDVTAQRDELMMKLGDIEVAVAKLESQTRRVELDNSRLILEKKQKEESFLGISNQLNEVNSLLNTLTMEPDDITRKYESRINELEHELERIKVEPPKSIGFSPDFETLIRSLTNAKETALAQLRVCQLELNALQEEHERVKQELLHINELRGDNESLATEIKRLAADLAATEAERNEILALYKQCVGASEFEIGQLQSQLMDGRHTVEQQYALIGEMDMEQSRLMLENSRLRERLVLGN